MEVFMAFNVPEVAPLLAANALVHLASAAAISIGLVAVGAIVTETLIMRAVLPADGTNSTVSLLTKSEAERTILLLVCRAFREWFAGCATGGLFPT